MTQEKLQHTNHVSPLALLKPVIIGIFIIPVSLSLWICGAMWSNYPNTGMSDRSPFRWFWATLLPAVISSKALKKKSLSLSGAILGYFIGFILIITSYAFFASLLIFFVTSSWATKFKEGRKQLLEENFKSGGHRNWVQVFCNGGVAAYLGIIYFIESGSGEYPIEFRYHYRQSWLSIAILSSISCANGDTWASELGTVMTDALPRLITTGKHVPRGTNGGITLVGVFMSAIGGLVVGLAYYITLLFCLDTHDLEESISQWPLIVTGLFAGLVGSLIDSLLGATCQFSGIDEKTGVIIEYPREGCIKISGAPWIDNHCVNLLSTFFTALIVTRISIAFWPK